MEMCKGSVLDRLECDATSSWSVRDDMARVFGEMAFGLAHCHAVGVVHRDVKPDNFLFGGESGRQVKITDFGVSKMMPPDGLLRQTVGTSPYMSPEMLAGQGYDERTDVWSLGVTVYVMLFGTFPYMPATWSHRHMKALIISGMPGPDFRPASPDIDEPPALAVDFVKVLLNRNAQERSRMHEVLRHSFVATESPLTRNSLGLGMGRALRSARAITREFEGTADPTLQLSVDKE